MISTGGLDLTAVSVGADRVVSTISLGELELWTSGIKPLTQVTQVKAATGAVGTAASFTHTVNTASAVAGDLYVLLVGCDGNHEIACSGDGWMRLAYHTVDPSFAVFVGYHGTAVTNPVFSFAASESYAVVLWHFRGATLDPLLIEASTVTTGSSATPNLGSYTATLGELPYLWFQAFGVQARAFSDAGPGWEGASSTAGSLASHGAAGGMWLVAEAATMDPPAATLSSSAPWAGVLLVVPPQLRGVPAPARTTLRMEKSGTLSMSSSSTAAKVTGMVASAAHPTTRVNGGDLLALYDGTVSVTAQVAVSVSSLATTVTVELWHNGTLLETKSSGSISNTTANVAFTPRSLQVARGDRLFLTARGTQSFSVVGGAATYVQVSP
ncbi:Uncharacterised protein [Mycobacteroides abscessus subsp. abscessus]|nr:Uncharacterised protein [Mycobacteroides abscessus subsp. abscessus]